MGEEARYRPTLYALVDFKSGPSYVACNRSGPLSTITRDYNVDVVVLPFEAAVDSLYGTDKVGESDHSSVNVTPTLLARRNKARDKLANFEKYAALQKLPTQKRSDQACSHALLIGLLWVALQEPVNSLKFTHLAFEAFHSNVVSEKDLVDFNFVAGLVKSSCQGSLSGSQLEIWADSTEVRQNTVLSSGRDGRPLVRYTLPLKDRAERAPFGTPCFIAPNGVMSYGQHGIPMARLQLAQWRARPNILPDISVAWRFSSTDSIGAGVLTRNAPGMPGSARQGNWLEAYKRHSHMPSSRSHHTKSIQCYLDVKSPHAFLCIEMAQQLESDFDVFVDFMPFNLDLADVYGDAKAPLNKSGQSKVPTPLSFKTQEEQKMVDRKEHKRSDEQRNIVKWTYADLRRYANLRGITLFGTERVWDSRLVLKAMLFCKSVGREQLDRFHDIVYPRLWRRDLNLHDDQAISLIVQEAVAAPLEDKAQTKLAFTKFASTGGQGDHLLKDVVSKALDQGVFGVPTFVIDGEPFWGKEHISLIRLRLAAQGLARRKDVSYDVAYLWRPTEPRMPTL